MAIDPQPHRSAEGAAGPVTGGEASTDSPRAARAPRAGWLGLTPTMSAALALLLFGGLCVYLVLAFLPAGLWEDGYFFGRYAFNTWEHGVMAWNPADGPLHGMTSQLYQLLIILVYPIAPEHLVTAAKIIAAVSLFAGYLCLIRTPGDAGVYAPARLALPFLGLGLPLVVNHIPTGLETLVVLPWLGLCLHQCVRFGEGHGSVWTMSALLLGTYLLRPDAVLIPLVALAPSLRAQPARAVKAYALAFAGLVLCLGLFKLYYGTALPLSFYIKTYLTTHQSPEHLALFFHEKLKNLAQLCYFFAPFFLITLVARHRTGVVLLVSGLVFIAYHAFATVETMGHYSRFYVPAVAPIVASAVASWPAFRRRAPAWLVLVFLVLWAGSFGYLKQIDEASRVYIFIEAAYEYPYVAAMTIFLLPIGERFEGYLAALALVVVAAGVVTNYRVESLAIEDDQTLLLRQIEPRTVFRGIRPLRELAPAHVYHTDMGAPGVLFLDAKVTDLDGLLNEEISLEGKRFAELCERDRPEAIFVPPRHAYPALRAEILRSDCIKGYRHVLRDRGARLHIREDLVKPYFEAARALGIVE